MRRVVFNRNFSVAVVVSNGKRSARWYSEKLGFESSVQGHWVTVWPKGAAWKIHLCQQPKGKLEPGNTGISFYAKDVEGTVKELKKRGVKFEMDLTKSEWGSLAMLKDPTATTSGSTRMRPRAVV